MCSLVVRASCDIELRACLLVEMLEFLNLTNAQIDLQLVVTSSEIFGLVSQSIGDDSLTYLNNVTIAGDLSIGGQLQAFIFGNLHKLTLISFS